MIIKKGYNSMNRVKFLILLSVILLAACGPISSSESGDNNSEPSARPTSTQPAQPTSTAEPLPTEETVVETTQNSPLVTPTNDNTSNSQVSPLATPTPEQPGHEDSKGKESDPINIAVDVAIIFRRSGGFAGVDEQWVIYTDGRIERPVGEQGKVDEQQVQTLLESIEDAGFFDLNDSYIPVNTCCDRFTYVITVQHNNQTKTVTTIDAAPDSPPELWQTIDAIVNLITNASQ